MEERRRSIPRFEDIPELIHNIQLRLSVREAARTSVLSKSWLHVWSTIPSLRFREVVTHEVSEEVEKELLKLVNRTLIRYLRDNIPVKIIDVVIDTENQESASFAVNWIRQMAIKSCLQELSLAIIASRKMFFQAIKCRRVSLTLPDEILSGKNLTILRVSSAVINYVWMPCHPVINCLSLRELDLKKVHISEEVVHNIFSTCSLLVKIKLSCCTGFNTIKVKNLHCLYELTLFSENIISGNDVVLEINDVPNIRSFSAQEKHLPINLDSLGSVTELSLSGIKILDQAFVDILQSKFPFLESLTLANDYWKLETFNFTCVSLKRISIHMSQHFKPVNITVYAPNLVSFSFYGKTMPSLLFPATNLELDEMKLHLFLICSFTVDESFFLKMRETLTFSRKCDLTIWITKFDAVMPSDINLDDLRRRVIFPAINVQQLSFQTYQECKDFGECSLFFDALFSICHPKHVVAMGDYKFNQNHFSEWLLREVMEKKTNQGYWGDYLKDVEVRRFGDEKWEPLTNSSRIYPKGPALESWVEFKLNWR